MLLEFLRGELGSPRFSADLRAALTVCHAEEELITRGDLLDPEENALRRQVMGAFRGYGRDEELFHNFPKEITWNYAVLEAEDLPRIRYIDYSYWNEISRGSSSPLDAVATIRAGIRIFDVPNDGVLATEQYLRRGGKLPPVILLTSGRGRLVIVEGHHRMTAYALAPETFPGSFAYVGTCSPEELRHWNDGYE